MRGGFSEIPRFSFSFLFSRRLFFFCIHLLRDVVDEDAADDVERQAARGVDARDGDVLVLVAVDRDVRDAGERDAGVAAGDRDDARAERRGVFGGRQELRRLAREREDDDELLFFHMARHLLHDGQVAVLKDVEAENLELQRELLRDVLREAAREQVNALRAADFLHDVENRVDGEVVDGVRDLEQRLVEDFVDIDVVLFRLRLLRQEVAELGKA